MTADSKPRAATARAEEIRALAGARALPPLLLVLYHYHEAHGYQHVRLFDVFVAKGYLWVEFFFALSGFILIHVYAPRAFRYTEFLKARLARLYPLHLATLLVMLAMVIFFRWLAAIGGYTSIYDLPAYHPYTSFWSFIGNLFLVQAWHLFPRLSWNGVSWFLSVLWFLCLIFPGYLWIARGTWWRGVLLVLAGSAILWWLIHWSPHVGLDITYDWGILRGIADFGIGVGLAVLYRELKPLGHALSTHWHSLAQALVFATFLYAIYHTGWSHTPKDYWVVPPLMTLLFVLAFDRGALAWVLQTPLFRLLGEWSFAIYMGQTTFLQLLRVFEARVYPNPAPSWTEAIHILEPVVLLLCCVAWGAALYYWVEVPAGNWLKRHWLSAKGTAVRRA
ncbi:MAG TPA: acyltransferase [Rhizomicrobium sp.]|jgi:peptidoglycan/LPS O-acetylase OafA/YrhL